LVVGENSLALQAASAAIVQMPEDCRGYFLSGKACFALGLQDESKEDFKQALELSDGTNITVAKAAMKYLAVIEKLE
jgi:Flp pilus assembly protein TadD